MQHPILYTFRRCPFAMRARMALFQAQIECEVREVVLRDKPAHMLEISPKGTVPVLLLPNGNIIDESLDVMLWALSQNDPDNWFSHKKEALTLIKESDGPFKMALDRYKYPNRYPKEQHTNWRAQGEEFLQKLEQKLTQTKFLQKEAPTLADFAIFPFIRQFRMPNPTWFDEEMPYPQVRNWLATMLETPNFKGVMQKRPPYSPNQELTYLLKNG